MLSREEALKILELAPNANEFDVERRYTMLAKRYRGLTDEASLQTVERFTEAYDVLTGRYVPPVPVDPKMEKVVLGKKKKDWKNIWEYGRLPLLITLAVVTVVGIMIYQIVTNPKMDFQLAIFGDFYKGNNTLEGEEFGIETKIQSLGIAQHPIIAFNPLVPAEKRANDPQLQYASQMKRMLMISGADEVDVLLLDKAQLDQIGKEGVLLEIDDFYAKLVNDFPETMNTYAKEVRFTLRPDVLPDGETAKEHIYAIDFSAHQVFNSLDVLGETQYLALCYHGKNKAAAEKIVTQLIADLPNWFNPDLPLFKTPEETSSFENETVPQTVVTSAP